MAKKQKKKKVREKLSYEIEVTDWDVYYHFGIAPKHLDMGAYWETSNLTLLGKILRPDLKIATKARIEFSADPEMTDYWSREPTIKSAKAVGFMEVPRGEGILQIRCSIPPRLSNNIHVAVSSGKIKYVTIFGEKLKWRKGLITSISLSAEREEVD
ncbi:hypothetical protein ACFL36_01215 [Thermodesulfobacteriota bacterium]